MLINRKSPLTGQINTMDLPITNEQLARYKSGDGHVQDIFSNLNPTQREFIMTGYTQEDWDTIFGGIEE